MLDSTLPEPGTLLDGRYRLGSVIGEGGMGRVFEGEDIRLSRRVAIKVMRDGSDEMLGERLFREAKAAARPEHPAVVTTYNYGTDPDLGCSYVVMERLTGVTLAQRIECLGPLPITFVLRVALETADALAAVHAAGIIHRDLKPSNIFLASRGRRVDEVKLLDFGVAKHLDLHTLTATGEVYGTPLYMAPEQLMDVKQASARSDLYSLGVVLFECLTGVPPFSARGPVALTAQILLGAHADLRALRPDVPDALAAAVARCMCSRPDQRFVDARSICAALETDENG